MCASLLLFGSITAHAATLGTTTVDLNSGTVTALVSGGITPGAVAPGMLTGLMATFPITNVNMTGTVISHSGGLSLSNGDAMVEIENFVINLNTDKLSGDVYAGGSLATSGLTFFDIGAGDTLTLDASLAGAINGAFGTNLAAGTPIGTASVSLVSATPEPSSMALVGLAGAFALVLLRNRRQQAL